MVISMHSCSFVNVTIYMASWLLLGRRHAVAVLKQWHTYYNTQRALKRAYLACFSMLVHLVM
jgi:hypothetical protein